MKRVTSSFIALLLTISIVISVGSFFRETVVYADSEITTEDIDRVRNKYNFNQNWYWTYDYTGYSSSNSSDLDSLATTGYKARLGDVSEAGYSTETYKSQIYNKKSGKLNFGEYIYTNNKGYTSIECLAFCELLGEELTGKSPNSDWHHYKSIEEVEALGGLKVGDVIRTDGHSVMVYKVEGEKFSVIEVLGGPGSKNRINVDTKIEGGPSSNSTRTTIAGLKNRDKFEYIARFNGQKKVSSFDVNNSTEFLDALLYASYSKDIITINVMSDIEFSFDDIYGISKYNSLFYDTTHKLSLKRPDAVVEDCLVEGHPVLNIRNCTIKGKSIRCDGAVRLYSNSRIENIYSYKTSEGVEKTEMNLFRCHSITNFGYIGYLSADHLLNVGDIEFAVPWKGYFSQDNLSLVNYGNIDFVYHISGNNYGTIDEAVICDYRDRPLNSMYFFANAGTIYKLWACNDYCEYENHDNEEVVEACFAYQTGGVIHSVSDNVLLDVIGGSVGPANSNSRGEILYSLKLKNLLWDEENDRPAGGLITSLNYNLLKERSASCFSYGARQDYNSDEESPLYKDVIFLFSSPDDLEMLLNNPIRSDVEYEFNVYVDITIEQMPKGDFKINLNQNKLYICYNSQNVTSHIVFQNGVYAPEKSVLVKTPNTLVFENMTFDFSALEDDVPFICDNGRIVFENCDVNDQIDIQLNNPNDIVEIYSDEIQIVGYNGNVKTAEYNICYDDDGYGVSEYSWDASQYETETCVYMSLENALNNNRSGDLVLKSDATIKDLYVGDYLNLKLDEVSLTVSDEFVNYGMILGNGSIVIENHENVGDIGYIGDSIIVDDENDDNPTIEPTATPTPTAKPTATPKPTVTPTPAANNGGIEGFCERLYTCALGRSSDSAGVQSWVDAIKEGADGAQAARGFFFSQEFIGKNLDNTEYVTRLYKTFMDRKPDAAGLKAWVDALDGGASREKVFDGFVNSQEWANICFKYGIKSGGTATPNIRLEPSAEILAFAERLYTTCLGRSADPSGLKAWAEALANREGSGAKVAHGFFFSDEFVGKNLDNGEFVRRCYLTFMDREPDAGGYAAWVEALDKGATREQVFNGFTQSPEFVALCEKAGIIAFG